MKIGIYDPYLDDLGGGEKYMMTIAECLTKKHEVSLFWDSIEDLETLKKRFSINLDGVVIKKNIFSRQVNLIDRILETKKYDVIIILSDGSIPLVLSKKLFIHIQQPLKKEKQAYSWRYKLKLSRISKVFYNSEFTKFHNQKLFPGNKNVVIYPPVSLFATDIAKENIILHVGRFRINKDGTSDYKKQSVMIEAFKKMVDHGLMGWQFIVAASVRRADGEKFSALQNSAKGYPINFLLNKNNDELWNMYNLAKIYWHASGFGEDLKNHPEYAEHFGIATVEAMGAGVVPVVINNGGQKEIISDGENGFFWNTLEELQAKTNLLIKENGLWMKMSEAARLRAKDFSKNKFCDAIIKLVED